MQFPIFIGLRRSLFLDLSVLIGASLSSAVVLAFHAEYRIQAVLLIAIWIVAFLAMRRLKPRLQSIRLERAGNIFAVLPGESLFVRMELEPLATVHPWLTVIRLKTETGDRYTTVIGADSLDSTNFRRLRLFIRWQKNVGSPGGDV